MPTNRPFFSSFLAAFRAHSALKSATTTSTVSSSSNSLSTQSTHLTAPTSQNVTSQPASTARGISTKTPTALTAATTAAAAAFTTPNTSHHHTRQGPGSVSRSPGSPLGAGFGNRNRRGSDSSSDGGFREVIGGEKWFIGGRTAQGEERFYRLGMVRRERSNDRASCDRMSL